MSHDLLQLLCGYSTPEVGNGIYICGHKNVLSPSNQVTVIVDSMPAQPLGSLLVLWWDTVSGQIVLWSDIYAIWPNFVQVRILSSVRMLS